MGRTNDRGYGYIHRLERKRMGIAVARGEAVCPLCRELILPGEPWDLDHTVDRSGYRGPAHQFCNRSDGGKRGNAKQRGRTAAKRWTI